MAGKTGTAHVADGKFGYDDGVYQASFELFPGQQTTVYLHRCGKTKPYAAAHFAHSFAAPVFKETPTGCIHFM